MKTAISIPDPVFEAAEEAAVRLAMSRSELYTNAVRDYLKAREADLITEKLNEIYADTPSELDPVIAEMQNRSITPEQW